MSEMWELHHHPGQGDRDRRYTTVTNRSLQGLEPDPSTSDLHAWSIYRQNLNSDFTDSALGTDERSPLPYGNFQLREQTVQSILRNPRLGPRSELGGNMHAYLKFGLPRVLPPKAKDGISSGYDSADERNQQSPMGPAMYGRSRSRNTERMLSVSGHSMSRNLHQASRAKSETDLREGMIPNRFRTNPNRGGNAHHHNNGHGGGGGGRVRAAASESNLLDGGGGNGMHHSHHIAGSQISLTSHHTHTTSRQAPSIRPGTVPPIPSAGANGHFQPFYFSHNGVNSAIEENNGLYKHPHLQVRNLCIEARRDSSSSRKTNKSRLVLDGISFDVRGGEMMAIMATNVNEGTTLLDTLSGRRDSISRVSGEFILNGNPLTLARLGARVGYVRRDYRLHPDITVTQTMHFYSTFKRLAGAGGMGQPDSINRIKLIIEDLGLTSVRHALVSSLTSSERQRLTVACQLVLNTDILILDQPTRGMDIFDTFFLITFLQQWTSSPTHPRVTLITIHPPTFEIYSIFSKVSLISTGRLMFYGHRTEMLPYFAFIEYPCPGFKNPSDYYIDLVTLDDLSAEALLESSQRIESLADSWRRRQEGIGEVGAPSVLPPKINTAPGGFFGEVWGIWKYVLYYTFPWNLVRWLCFMLVASSVSVLVGAIYWNVRLNVQNQNSAYDRFGQHFTLMVLTPWPILLILLSRDKQNIPYVTRDIEEGLYSKSAYVIGKTIIELPFVISIFLAYVIPAYVMAGIPPEKQVFEPGPTVSEEINNFFIVMGYMLLYLYTLRCFLHATSQAFVCSFIATTLSGLGFLALALTSGYVIHFKDLGSWCSWIKYISPVSWLLKPIERTEFSSDSSFEICNANPIVMLGGLMQRLSCGLKNDHSVLSHYDMTSHHPLWLPIAVSVGFILICNIGSVIGFIIRRHEKSVPDPDKP